MKKIMIIAGSIVFIFLILMFAVSRNQAKLIFFPGRLPAGFVYNGGEELTIKTNDGEQINALFFRGTENGVILYFHGNAGDLSNWQDVYGDFRSTGLSMLIIDYRGYGKSTGTISEKGLYADGQAAMDYLKNELKFNPHDIIVYGRSIGSGIAVETAVNNQLKALVLEAPFQSLTRFARDRYAWLLPGLYLKFNFDNDKKIKNVKIPVLIIHGTHDEVIPLHYGKALFDAYDGPGKFVAINGATHNNLSDFPEYFLELADFLKNLPE